MEINQDHHSPDQYQLIATILIPLLSHWSLQSMGSLVEIKGDFKLDTVLGIKPTILD